MDDEIKQLLTELMEHFEMDTGEWPMVSIYHGGSFYRGVVDDSLHDILLHLQEKLNEEN